MAWYPIPSHVFKEGRVEKRGGPIAERLGKMEIAVEKSNVGFGQRKFSNQVIKHYF